MKNIIKLLALPCIIALLMTSCSKSSDNGGGGSSDGKHLTKISETVLIYDANETLIETETSVININWSGDLVTKMEFHDDGEYEESVVFSYNNNLLEFATVTDYEGEVKVLRFNYTGENITSIDIVEEDGEYESIYLSYNNNNQLIGIGDDDLYYNITWSANDVIATEVENEENCAYTYDTKNNPLNNLAGWFISLTNGDFSLLSEHNVATRLSAEPDGYNNQTVCSYEYNEDQYPVSCTFITTDNYYHMSGSIEYIY